MVDPTRSRIMSAIKGKNTKPELVLRKALHRKGIRYRIHLKTLPGCPDIVLSKQRAIILVNGCFWHKHNCHLFNPKRILPPAWNKKIDSNVERDKRNQDFYIAESWRVIIVWECAITGKTMLPIDKLTDQIINWLNNSQANFLEISGK